MKPGIWNGGKWWLSPVSASFKGGRVREISRTALPGPAAEDFAVAVHDGRRAVRVGLTSGRVVTVVP